MKNSSNHTNHTDYKSVFTRINHIIIILACLIILAGFFLMSGEGSTPQHFNPEIFSSRRIVIAPVVCLTGYLLIIVGILWRRPLLR